MKAPSDQCAFSGWIEISGPQLSWEKPKISPTSWAWAVRDSLSPWPPQVSESTSVCRDSVFCPGHSRQDRSPGARPSKGAAPSWKKVVSHAGGLPSASGSGKRERGSPCLSPLFNNASSFTSSFPFQICRLCCVARSRPERCLGQQTRGCTGPAQSGGRGLDRHLSRALRKEPGHLILTHCALCRSAF